MGDIRKLFGFVVLVLLVGCSFCWAANAVVSTNSYKTILEAKAFALKGQTEGLERQELDYRYQPHRWQSLMSLVDDPHKSVIGMEGRLYYGFKWQMAPRDQHWFYTQIVGGLEADGENGEVSQKLLDAKTPIVITERKTGKIMLRQEAWSWAPKDKQLEQRSKRRVDYLWLKMKNTSEEKAKGRIVLSVDAKRPLVLDEQYSNLIEDVNGAKAFCSVEPACVSVEYIKNIEKPKTLKLRFEEVELAPDEEFEVIVRIYIGENTSPLNTERNAERAQKNMIDYWKTAKLPYDKIKVADSRIQEMIDGCIRNVYQMREKVDGVMVFRIGPTVYRGTYAADGAFFSEAIVYLGRMKDARKNLEKLIEKDGGPSGVTFSKKAGLRLWTIWRHAQLTGDWTWLEQTWSKVEREVNNIKEYRQMSMAGPEQANSGLMPIGTGDGGLWGWHREYTNVYWTLAGLKAAIEMAEKMEKPVLLSDWKAEYADYWAAFDKARNRDKKADEYGNIYMPVTMKGEEDRLPQCGAWSFMHSVYPGRIFDMDDELMLGMMAMLDATEKEGLVYGTGWNAKGIWGYAGSFWGHAHLWLGHGRKMASAFYAFANHACPMLCWREEQGLVGTPGSVGDMPHNWASVEFIRMVRHMMILERGGELHLLEGLPTSWTEAGSVTELSEIATSFGPVSIKVEVTKDGKSASIKVEPPVRQTPEKIVVHLENFMQKYKTVRLGRKKLKETVEIPTDESFTLNLQF